jgi:excisionase family DNA binding protein
MKDFIRKPGHEFLTTPEVSKLLRLSVPTIHRFIKEGELPRIKMGKRVFIYVEDLREFVNARYGLVKEKNREVRE